MNSVPALGMVLVVDPRAAGISGDMMLSALVDMGAGDMASAMAGCARFLEGSAIHSIKFVEERRGGIRCTRMVLDATDPHSRPAAEMLGAVHDAASSLGLSGESAAFADRCIQYMVSAEEGIHGAGARLHESASVDTLVDIVGTALAMDRLALSAEDRIVMPVNVGGGTTVFSHGTFPNPVPAVLDILRRARIPMTGSPVNAETTTPTGACILAGLQAATGTFYPGMVASRTGRGAGSRDLEGLANMLTLIQGAGQATQSISVLESNIDDVTGETLGRVVSAAMAMGAADASVYPGTGKKGRPTFLLVVLCPPALASRMADMIIDETGTLGVRMGTSERYVVSRDEKTGNIDIDGSRYAIRYKVRTHRGESHFKIEFDDIAAIAGQTGMAAHHIERLARRQIEDNQ